MFRYIFALAIILAVAYGQDEEDTRIVGGTVTTINRYPFQASLRDAANRHICGGTIVARRTILTGVSCIREAVTVVVGSTFLNRGGTRLNITTKNIHPLYNATTRNWDAALAILNADLPLGPTVAIIQLRSTEPSAGTTSTTSGWGAMTEGGRLSNRLRVVSLPIVSRAVCITNYAPRVITPIMICAGLPGGGRGACRGDAGGPLVTAVGGIRQLSGIASWGEGCGRPNKPGVYTNVVRLVPWIQSIAV